MFERPFGGPELGLDDIVLSDTADDPAAVEYGKRVVLISYREVKLVGQPLSQLWPVRCDHDACGRRTGYDDTTPSQPVRTVQCPGFVMHGGLDQMLWQLAAARLLKRDNPDIQILAIRTLS